MSNLKTDYDVRLATLEKLGGDMTKKYATIYDVDLAILDKTGQGGGGLTPEQEALLNEVPNKIDKSDVLFNYGKIVDPIGPNYLDINYGSNAAANQPATTLKYFYSKKTGSAYYVKANNINKLSVDTSTASGYKWNGYCPGDFQYFGKVRVNEDTIIIINLFGDLYKWDESTSEPENIGNLLNYDSDIVDYIITPRKLYGITSNGDSNVNYDFASGSIKFEYKILYNNYDGMLEQNQHTNFTIGDSAFFYYAFDDEYHLYRIASSDSVMSVYQFDHSVELFNIGDRILYFDPADRKIYELIFSKDDFIIKGVRETGMYFDSAATSLYDRVVFLFDGYVWTNWWVAETLAKGWVICWGSITEDYIKPEIPNGKTSLVANKTQEGVEYSWEETGMTPEQEALLNEVPNKMDQVRLITDGSVITDVDYNILTFNDIYNLVMDNSKYVYIVMYNNIRFRVSAYDGDAIWFDSTFIEEGKPNILRCIINSDNQVSVDQIVVAKESDFWSGTQDEWDALPVETQNNIKIALITE